MSIDTNLISQFGIIGFLGYFFIKEGFAYLKSKKGGNGVEGQLKLMSENHLNSIERAILDQTRLFQDDHKRIMDVSLKQTEVLYKIQAGVENLNKK